MPRKKADPAAAPIAAAPSSSPAPAVITCPGCKSKISADGKTLHEKSSAIEELEMLDQVEAANAELKKKIAVHEATIADLRAGSANLRAQLADAQKKSAVTTITLAKEKKGDGELVREKTKQRSGDGGGKPSWWD